MWKYNRRLSLRDRPMTIKFSKWTLKLSADGVVLSEVDEELHTLLGLNPAFRYIPPAVSAVEDTPVEEATTADAAECDIIQKPKSSRKRASSRSRRKSSSDKQD